MITILKSDKCIFRPVQRAVISFHWLVSLSISTNFQFNLKIIYFSGQLHDHLKSNNHCDFDNGDGLKKYDQPEYFFSTYEDDAFLCSLDDELMEDNRNTQPGNQSTSSAEPVVIVEESQVICANKDAEELYMEIMCQ